MNLDLQLGQDETVNSEYEFSYSLILFFLKSHFWVTNKRLIVNSPNVLFVIPTGSDTVTYPLRSIGGVKTKTEFKFLSLLGGVVLLLIGISSLRSGIGLLLLPLGVATIVGAFRTVIAIVSAGTGAVTYSHLPWEAEDAKKMINQLNQEIANI
ncbi:hypothetical protein [Cylindrospermum sp. FACHB-282]|uniref:hypothetical protein n=1 Tax=Cylindrospermum sp. FACHB-282 TaxID=2692794 RepID=UPI001686549A|nr:hypothetical protein [Cylindrospermum sp. FACHB-282]MBD2386602.1 hypothetical protein [Cylindrospermum sp. FACHB-282]